MAPIERSSEYTVIPNPGGTPEVIEVTLAEQLDLARAELKVANATVDELLLERLEAHNALWECVKLTGADVSDGPPRYGTGDWPQLPELAVREVARLREEVDSDG